MDGRQPRPRGLWSRDPGRRRRPSRQLRGWSRQAILGLGLRSDEAKTIEPPEATDQLFEGLEVLLRIFTPGRLGMRDVYVATPPDAPPTGQWRSACVPTIA